MNAFLAVSVPLFGIIGAGWLAGRFHLFNDHVAPALNAFVYFIALPALFIKGMATAPLSDLFNADYLLVVGGGYFLAWIPAIIIGRLFFAKRLGELSLHSGATIFANSGNMGVPLIILAFGDEAILLAIAGVLFNATVIFICMMLMLEIDRVGGMGKLSLSRLGGPLLEVLRNPLLVSAFIGFCIAGSGLELPQVALQFLDLLGQSVAPCALFGIGLVLSSVSIRGELVEVGYVSLYKLIVHPAATWFLAVWVWPLEPLEEAVAVTVAALPTGVLIFILADRYGVYRQRAAAAILVSTALGVITASAVVAHYH